MNASITRNIGLTLVGNVAAPAASFLTAPLLARALDVAGRGELAAATAPLMLGLAALTLGLPESLTYFVARASARVRTYMAVAVVALLLTSIVAFAFVHAFADVLAAGDAQLAALTSLATLALAPALLLGCVRGVAAGQARWGLISLERVVASLARLGWVGALYLTNNLTLVNATVAMAATTFAGIVVYIALALPRRASTRAAGPHDAGVGAFFGYGMRIWFGAFAGIVLSRIDQLLMTPLASAFELGIYVVAVSVSEIVMVFNSAVRDVMFGAESAEPQAARLALAARLSTLVTSLAAVLVLIVGGWGIPWLFGQEYAAAYPVTGILLAAVVLGNPGSVAGAGLSARGRPELRSVSLALACVANVLVLILLAPTLGATGAALATLVGNAIAGGLNIVWLRKYFGMRGRDFFVIRPADLAAVGGAVRNALGRKARR